MLAPPPYPFSCPDPERETPRRSEIDSIRFDAAPRGAVSGKNATTVLHVNRALGVLLATPAVEMHWVVLAPPPYPFSWSGSRARCAAQSEIDSIRFDAAPRGAGSGENHIARARRSTAESNDQRNGTPTVQALPMAPDELATEHLKGERLRLSHLAQLVDLHRDGRVMATLGGIRSRADTERFVETSLDHWQRNGFGLWIFRQASDGTLVGRAGLRRVHVGDADEVEIAYVIKSELWGRGLATEISRRLIGIGMTELQLGSLVAFTLADNRASIRVMEKAGLHFERALDHRGKPHVLYRIDAPE